MKTQKQEIYKAYLRSEQEAVEALLKENIFDAAFQKKIEKRALALSKEARKRLQKKGGVESLVHAYSLASEEGLALMCLAEALLRIPDDYTRDLLIENKLSQANWSAKEGSTLMVKASTFLMGLTQKVLGKSENSFLSLLKAPIKKASTPVIRKSVSETIKILGKQFVMGSTIEEAIKRATEMEKKGYTYSYDMLGEAATTREDAKAFFDSYKRAIKAIKEAPFSDRPEKRPNISVKLSALYPRYQFSHRVQAKEAMVPLLKELMRDAMEASIGFTIDAEEVDRLDLSLEIIEEVFLDPEFSSWEWFGVVVQAYQKRAPAVIDYLKALSQKANKRMMVRLVKGAYWDSEIKRAQQNGLGGYPVYTRKSNTDLSYLVCAKKLLESPEFYSRFATHNAHTVMAILEMGKGQAFEFQKLHGMGTELYDQLIEKEKISCRVYAPVGEYRELLAYLVRRLLENGANTSFVNHLADNKIPLETLVEDPVAKVKDAGSYAHDKIPLPEDLYGGRKNSQGIDWGIYGAQDKVLKELSKAMQNPSWKATPLISGKEGSGPSEKVFNPANTSEEIGVVHEATKADVAVAMKTASEHFILWEEMGAEKRAEILETAADLLEKNKIHFMVLCIKEAGKTIIDAIDEVREAVDFCRYYALRARREFSRHKSLPGPTGEENTLSLHARGVFGCISPWNFPLAIFMGQVTGALAAGNAVVAKPASQTPIVAYEAVKLLHQAGVPKQVLHLVIGSGSTVGQALLEAAELGGIVFTGSVPTAQHINKTLAARPGAIVPLIAETGGMNAMIVDSSALPEQVTLDVMRSAFQSAGQRCSALRLLFIQEDVADNFLKMIKGAMDELTIGDPVELSTDVGPVIDHKALKGLESYAKEIKAKARSSHICEGRFSKGHFFAPQLHEISIKDLPKEEVFGPIVHVVRFKAKELPLVLDTINRTEFGLTLGVHSRVDQTIGYIKKYARVGNMYINRNMIGAVVGVQPFGGEGLSGTGPKAGGPHYLHAMATERTQTTDTTAAGGNASLLSLEE